MDVQCRSALIAWGAYFAEKRDDAAGLSLIPALLKQQLPSEGEFQATTYDEATYAQRKEMAELLHVAITTGGTVEAEDLAQLDQRFPVQALVLAARLPVKARSPLLLRWYGTQDKTERMTLVPASAMLLAQDPSEGFAASVVQDTKAYLHLAVIFFGSSSHCGPVPPDFHHPVLSQMLGIPESSMAWQRFSTHDIEWKDTGQFLDSVHHRFNAERKALDATVTSLFARGLLTPQEAKAVRPQLVIDIDDQRTDKSQPLPSINFDDPQTRQGKPPTPWECLVRWRTNMSSRTGSLYSATLNLIKSRRRQLLERHLLPLADRKNYQRFTPAQFVFGFVTHASQACAVAASGSQFVSSVGTSCVVILASTIRQFTSPCPSCDPSRTQRKYEGTPDPPPRATASIQGRIKLRVDNVQQCGVWFCTPNPHRAPIARPLSKYAYPRSVPDS